MTTQMLLLLFGATAAAFVDPLDLPHCPCGTRFLMKSY